MADTKVENKLRLTKVDVYAGHIVCIVQFAPTGLKHTTPKLMSTVLKNYPNLPKHACVNGSSNTFCGVMNSTPLPHLLEHIIVDAQVHQKQQRYGENAGNCVSQCSEMSQSTIVGTSEWLDESAGIARIDVSFHDDLQALSALNEAVYFLNDALAGSSKS